NSQPNITRLKDIVIIETNIIYFETGKTTLDENAIRQLNNVAVVMQRNADFKHTITGHTDIVGNDALNDNLSSDRSNAVAEYLIKAGVNKDQLTTKAMGKNKPIDNRDNSKGLANNRRVELSVK